MIRSKNRGLLYARRSTDKQEISLPSQVEWAIAAAAKHGVTLDASVADLEHMQANRLSSFKALRIDDGITGADLNRPGFLAVNQDAFADRTISHVFIYKRDRFARPADTTEIVQIEKKLRKAGITIVLSDAIAEPFVSDHQDIAGDIGLMIGYYQGGEELRKHAERVLGYQRVLARDGNRTGGNAPYGFARWLVDNTGRQLEKLPPGKVVQQSGCHVRVIPDDPEKIMIWLNILEWKEQGWGIKRIAKKLNELGIPSPDAGRVRTDHGVKHRVSGKWHPNTVAELCRNPIIVGIQQYGRRSEGSIRRLGPDGPRLLDETDRTQVGEPRIILNEPSLIIQKQIGESKFETQRWLSIQEQMNQRGQVQKGIPRVKDPARYPLACRLVDLTNCCGAILYARTNQGRAVYTCGRYMRTSGAECESNQIDGEAMLRFVVKTIQQLVDRHGNHDKLRQKLLERAKRATQDSVADPGAVELANCQIRHANQLEELQTIEYRMSRERDDELYNVLKREREEANSKLTAIVKSIHRLEASKSSLASQSPEQMADAALSLLSDVTRITSNPEARAALNPLFIRLGLRVGLNFGNAIKGKQRIVRRLLSGVMTFGDTPLPVPLHGKDNDDGPHDGMRKSTPIENANSSVLIQSGESTAASDVFCGTGRHEGLATEAATQAASVAASDHPSARPTNCQPEGMISITKVNRGERIRTADLLVPSKKVYSTSPEKQRFLRWFCPPWAYTFHRFAAFTVPIPCPE